MKYLVDTCVWRDYLEERVSESGRMLGNEAAEFFQKVISGKHTVLISETIIDELMLAHSLEELNYELGFLLKTGMLQQIQTTYEEHTEAKRLAQIRKLPYADCIHAIQARNNGANVISQDKHLLFNLNDIANAQMPKDCFEST